MKINEKILIETFKLNLEDNNLRLFSLKLLTKKVPKCKKEIFPMDKNESDSALIVVLEALKVVI